MSDFFSDATEAQKEAVQKKGNLLLEFMCDHCELPDKAGSSSVCDECLSGVMVRALIDAAKTHGKLEALGEVAERCELMGKETD